jgi:hypothetical protein
MNTIFDFIEATIFTKNSELLQSTDDEKEFSPFMVNRWVSMYSPEMANVVNETTNRYSTVFENKREVFNFYVSVLPKVKFKRIAYIKKNTKDDKDIENIELMAKSQQTSQRDIKHKIELVALLKSVNNI